MIHTAKTTEEGAKFNPARLDECMGLVILEFVKAVGKHEPFPTCHHGHSVIQEELEELWDEIKANKGTGDNARKEAAQTAATALRYLYDLC